MTRHILPLLALILNLLLVTACTPVTDPNGGDIEYTSVPYRSEDPPVGYDSSAHMAIVEYLGVDFSDAANIQNYSRARILVLNPYVVWGTPGNENAIAQLKAANPDLRVIGYFNSQTSWVSWGEGSMRDSDTYEADWARAVEPYWSYTTTGDTMMAWPGKVVLDILDPDCREAMVGVLATHWQAHESVFDGIFWDHFNTELWVDDSVPGCDGELDLDRDGVPHHDDENEIQAYREASVDLIERVRVALGNDIIQVANGNRAAKESEFAGILDGTMYENFPSVGFATNRERQALDPGAYNNLFAARNWFRQDNGGPYLILSNTKIYQVEDPAGGLMDVPYADFVRVVALLSENYVSYHESNGVTTYGWPTVDLDLGNPLGEAVVDGDLVSREFERGSISLDFGGRESHFPFAYEVFQDGNLIYEFHSSVD